MFAERLKYLRTHYKGRKMTQDEMSKLLKIQRSTCFVTIWIFARLKMDIQSYETL